MKELHKAYSNINILIVIGYPHIISATIAKKKNNKTKISFDKLWNKLF